MMTPTVLLALSALMPSAHAAKAPSELSEPLWVDLDPLQPRMCISMVPDAGLFKKRDATGWAAVRTSLEAGEVATAVSTARSLKTHPAQRTVAAAAYLLGDGQAIDLEPLIEKYPDDACLAVMAAAVALKGGDTAGMVRNTETAHTLLPDHPDVAELYALAGSTAEERAKRFKAAVESNPDDLSLRYAVAKMAEQDGDLDTAVAGYRRVWELGYTEVADDLEKMALRAGDLDTYLRLALDEDHPVKGPGFEDAEDYGAAFYAWLGFESEDDHLIAVLETSMGELECVLLPRNAPVTVMNFVGLARGEQPWTRPTGLPGEGPLYDDTIFHRVIPEFMVQAGDPEGNGQGGPGYRFADEPSPRTAFDRPGLMAMANSGPDTNGSQFFITEAPTPHLSGKHTLFGTCTRRAVALVQRMARVDVGAADRPVDEIVLQNIRFETREASE